MSNGFLSKRVKKRAQSGITSDRYEFLGLDQAEPDLGDPIIGPSSTGANPVPPTGSNDTYILVNVAGNPGKRYWLNSTSLPVGGLSPGSFTVFNNDVQVGIANSFNVFNFVGAGVTVDYVSPDADKQTGIATIRIQVTDLIAPGNPYEIPYYDPGTGFLEGATGVVFRSNNVGIGSTLPTEKLDVLGNVNISGQIESNTAVVGFITATTSYSGISTVNDSYIRNNLNVGTSSTVVKTLNGNVGIGSTIPQYKLDVFGSSRFYGAIYDYLGNPGESGQVLTSKGNNNVEWNFVGLDTPVKISESVVTKEATNDQFYYIGLSSTTNDITNLYVDSNGLYYNPSSVSLGIGTQPSYALDVSGTIRADQILVESLIEAPGIVTTTSTNEVVIDTFNTSQYRSARYNIQVTTNDQLRLGTASVSGLSSGQNYSPGIYEDVSLVSSGIGTGAKATITVNSLPSEITQSFGGIFTTSSSIVGIPTGTTVILDTTLTPNDYEQSKLTSIQITNSGSGFTTVPNITIDSPIIVGNPVPGVGIGSTAIVTNVSMKVTNATLNTVGVVTNVAPTTTFVSPIGTGETATGYVGFGISTFTVTGFGSAYTSSPTVTYNQTPTSTPVTRVGLGISDAGIQITPGTGYNTGITTITITPVGGIGTGAQMSLQSIDTGSGGITKILIVNVGSGYTVPPTVTITNSASGVGAAITITQMIVTNIDVDDPGSGFGASKPIIGFSGGGGSGATATVDDIILTNIAITNSGYGYTSADMPVTATISTPGVGNTVGLGVYQVLSTTGFGYTTNPSFTIDSPTLSPFVGTSLTSILGYNSTFNLFSGPGYGGETVYYIDPIDSNSFRLTKDSEGTNYITLGYDVSSNPGAYIGGTVSSVSITNSGSGYEVGDVITTGNSDLESYGTAVGTGFSFTVAGPLIESFQVSDVMLLQSVGSASTEASVVEYAGIANFDNLGECSADISGGNARLKFTPTYAHNTIKLTRKGTEL